MSSMPLNPIHVGPIDAGYPVLVAYDLVAQPNLLADYILGKQVFIIASKNLTAYLPQIETLVKNCKDVTQVDVMTILDGDEHKSLEAANTIWEALIKKGHRRDTTLIALGGGVIGDLVGFVSATYMRGVNWINFPTTLLAQVDAAIGGKTAINHQLGKNLIGAFHAPKAVISQVKCLETLSDAEYIAGLAEVVKYGLALDEAFFKWLQSNIKLILNKEHTAVTQMVSTCSKIKAGVVTQDFKEKGLRAILNFGHTIGHAIETAMDYKIRHGEAVSIGMVGALKLSVNHGLNDGVFQQAVDWLKAVGLPVKIPAGLNVQSLLEPLLRDKKSLSDAPIRVILLPRLGHATITTDISQDQISDVLVELGAR